MKNFSVVLVLVLVLQTASAAEVNVYSARKEALIKPLFDRFTAETGIVVNLVTGKADALIKRLELEGENSPADLLITVDAGRLHRARQAGVLQAVESEVLNASIPASYRDPAGYWYGLSLRARIIVYNREQINPEALNDYEQLADSRWRGQLCVRSSSNIYNQSLVASLIAHHGPAKTEHWARGLIANLARAPKGGDRDQIKAVAVGQCQLALVNSYYLAGMLHSRRPGEADAAGRVGLFWPNQTGRGAHVNISGAGVVAAAKNPSAAVHLLEYLVSDAAQKWYADSNHELPITPGLKHNDRLAWGTFKADDLNMAALGEFNAEAVRIMDRAGWK